MIEEKIKIIDEIIKRHPSYGVDKGWSCYVGGMKDSGDWYFRKMLDVPIDELQAFLNGLIADENKPKVEPIYSEQEIKNMNTWYQGNGRFINEYTIKKLRKLNDEVDARLIFGKKRTP